MIRRPPSSTLFPSRRSSDLPFIDSRFSDGSAAQQQYRPMTSGVDCCQRRTNGLFLPVLRIAEFYTDRKSTRLNSSHVEISYAVFCLKKKKTSPSPSFL